MSTPAGDRAPLTRRVFVGASAAVPVAWALAACGDGDQEDADGTAARELAPTPACDDGDGAATPEQTEGPFFRPSSPERDNLREAGVTGTPLLLSGRVLSTGCRPVRGALLDFWQADGGGSYDNSGFRLRGHQFSDSDGRFRLATVAPGRYPGRTPHIHVKVQPRGGAILTTQLYLPGEPTNEGDGLFMEELLVTVSGSGSRRRARFDFVVEA